MHMLLKKMILSLYSALLRPHLDYYIHLRGSQNRKDINLLGMVQRRL